MATTIKDKYKVMFEFIVKKKSEIEETLSHNSTADVLKIYHASYNLNNNRVNLEDSKTALTDTADYYCTNKFIITPNLRLILINKKYVKADVIYKELYDFFELYADDIKDSINKRFYIAETYSPEDPDYIKAKFVMDSYKRSISVNIRNYEKSCRAYEKLQTLTNLALASKTEMEIIIQQKKNIFTKPLKEIVEHIKNDMEAIRAYDDVETCEFTEDGAIFKVWPIVLSQGTGPDVRYACVGGVEFQLNLSKGHVTGKLFDKNDLYQSSHSHLVPAKYVHPHLSSGTDFCMGDSGGRQFRELCNKGELQPTIKFLVDRIKQYNPRNPYFSLGSQFKLYKTIREALENERIHS